MSDLWIVKRKKEKKMTLKLQEEDIVLIDNVFMQRTFDQYYSNLYKGHDIPLEKIDEYLRK